MQITGLSILRQSVETLRNFGFEVSVSTAKAVNPISEPNITCHAKGRGLVVNVVVGDNWVHAFGNEITKVFNPNNPQNYDIDLQIEDPTEMQVDDLAHQIIKLAKGE